MGGTLPRFFSFSALVWTQSENWKLLILMALGANSQTFQIKEISCKHDSSCKPANNQEKISIYYKFTWLCCLSIFSDIATITLFF